MKILDPAGVVPSAIAQVQVVRWEDDLAAERGDAVALEEPLEIRLAGCSVAVTMRTPGADFDLAAGFLFTEGIVAGEGDITSIAWCPADDGAGTNPNVVNVNPVDPALVDPSRWQRNFFATSSCGLCGKSSIESVHQHAPPVESDLRLSYAVLYSLDAQLRVAQTVFGQTGGLHAAGLFDSEGRLQVMREDVGRHNAVDKVIGHALQEGHLPLRDRILMVSGRASFEIMQKALMAGIPVVAAVSAPSSLAVDLARSGNMTLIGFLRTRGTGGGRFNIYTGAERIV